jgi:hypothetical protein
MVPLVRRATVPFRYLRRLPRGSDRSVGAGYAMALAATAATVLYFVVQALGTVTRPVSIGPGSPGPVLGVDAAAVVLGTAGAAGVVGPVAFVAGVVSWRVVPERVPYSGGLSGVLATILVYLGVCVGAVVGSALFAALTGETVASAVVSPVLVVAFVFVFTCWLTLPVGLLTGMLYERSLTARE